MLGKLSKFFLYLFLLGWIAGCIFNELGYIDYRNKATIVFVVSGMIMIITFFGHILNQPFVVRIDDSDRK